MSIEFPHATPWHPSELEFRTLQAFIDHQFATGALPKWETDETEKSEESDD